MKKDSANRTESQNAEDGRASGEQLAQAGPIVGHEDGIAGIGRRRYLMLAGWPATSRSRRTWLSSPVMSCAV